MPGFEWIDDEERQAVDRIFTHGNGVLFAHGFDQAREKFYVREFEGEFAQKVGAKYALAVSSGTAALLVGLKALGVGPGDEVVTQSFTFVATVEAIMMLGAIPVITEINGTYNMDPDDLAEKITDRTKAILPVHMAGVPAEMGRIREIASQHGVPILEDTAQSLGARFEGKMLGTVGDVGAYSLDFGKTITCGEGGVIVTDDLDIYQGCLAFHDHGHQYDCKLSRAQDTRVTWGLNFRMNEMSAAVASVQLSKLDFMIQRAKEVKRLFSRSIQSIPGITLRAIPEQAIENYDSLIFSVESESMASEIIAAFQSHGVATKNIPDALRWHFSGMWEHIFCANKCDFESLAECWPKSRALLSRSIALPIMLGGDDHSLSTYINKVSLCIRHCVSEKL